MAFAQKNNTKYFETIVNWQPGLTTVTALSRTAQIHNERSTEQYTPCVDETIELFCLYLNNKPSLLREIKIMYVEIAFLNVSN